MRNLLSVFLLLILTSFAYAQQSFTPEYYFSGTDTLRFRLLKPLNYNPDNSYPVVISLHGAGERGYDNKKQLVYISDLFLDSTNRAKYPCFVFAPQCPPEPMRWSMCDRFENPVTLPEEESRTLSLAMRVFNVLMDRYSIDRNRIYITGLSQGGCGTYDMLIRYPEMFAAAAPICGWSDTSKAGLIKDIPLWIFHGDSDNVVQPEHSRNMVKALKDAGGNPKYTEYLGVNHGSWLNAYKEPDFFEWLFSQKRKSR